ncbi:MAG: carboxypeptidase M32 [Micavibrio sp.]
MALNKNYWDRVRQWASGLPLIGKSIAGGGGKAGEILRLPPPRKPDDVPNTKQYEEHPSASYMDLKMIFRDIGRMNAIGEALGRDFLTAMPEGAYKSRLGQIAFLYRRLHEELANENMAKLIEEAHAHEKKAPQSWDPWDSANLREMETAYRHVALVDPDLIERKARLAYEGRKKHRDVLRFDDWEEAKPFLEDMIDLQRRIADAKALKDNDHPTDAAYQALMREYMPGVRLKEVESLFGRMEEKLKEILPWVLDEQAKRPEPLPLTGPFPAAQQLWLNKSLLKVMGFDFERGGLYETGHNPVEGGTPEDTRLVIKTSDATNFLDSMKSALHEGGHGIYIQGLPREAWRYQPVAQDLGAAVHESQALLVEMILGRTKEFFSYLAPRVEGLFQKFGDPAMTAENLYRLKTHVKPGCDRKSADEITYFFHILLRMRLEKDLIAGRLSVKELPDAWNAGMKELLGVEPQTHAQGCLQDVHWFVGKFGYFPSYTMGQMMAAQIYDKMKKDIQNIPELMASGDFLPVQAWLAERIYAKGRLMRTDELLETVTGSRLTPGPLINHLQDRYLAA